MPPPKPNAGAVVGTIIGVVALIGIVGGGAMLLLGKQANGISLPCAGGSCKFTPPPESGSDIAWNLQWFDSQHHVGITGTTMLDEKTGAQANLSLSCWGGTTPTLKVGIAYANFDAKTEQHLHREYVDGQSVYTPDAQTLDVATMLDSQYDSDTVKLDTVNSFKLDDGMYSTQHLLAASQFKVIFGANGKRQVVAVNLKDEAFAKFLSECDLAYQAEQKAEADAAAQRAAEAAREAAAAAVHLKTYNKSADSVFTITDNYGDFHFWPNLDDVSEASEVLEDGLTNGSVLRIVKVHRDGNGVDDYYSIIWQKDDAIRSGWVAADDFDKMIGQERSGTTDAPPPQQTSPQDQNAGGQP